MKRWKKRLTLFSLLLAGSMVWNISGVRVKAEDAVPQVTINIKNGKDVKVNGVEVSITTEQKTLTTADFANADPWEYSESDYSEDNQDNGEWYNYYMTFNDEGGFDKKCITAGKIIVTIKPGTGSGGIRDQYLEEWGDNISIGCTPTEALESPEEKNIDYLTSEDSFVWNNDESCFQLDNSFGKTGIVKFLKWNGKKYVVNFPVEIHCTDYLDGISVGTSSKKSTGYEASGSEPMNYILDLQDNEYIVKVAKYDKNIGAVNTIYPIYAYGASGIDAIEVLKSSSMTSAYRTEQPLVKNDTPFEFKVKNKEGDTKIYKVRIEMPWKLSIEQEVASNYSPIIYVNDERKDNTTLDDVSYGSTVKVAFTIPSGKKLTGIKAINTSNLSDVYDLKYIIDGSNISFQMPKETITITEIEVEDYSTEARNITATPVVKDGSETDFAIIEKKVDNQNVSTASEGKTVVLTAGEMKQNYTSLCGYQFDHWESTSITISSKDSKKSVLTFKMPDRDVDVKAVYVKTGVSITIGTSNSLAGNTRITNHNPIQESSSSTSDSKTTITEYCRAGQYRITMTNLNTMGYRFLGWIDENGQPISTTDTENVKWNNFIDADVNFTYLYPTITVTDETAPMTFIASFEAKTGCTLNFTSSDEKQGTVSAKIQDTDITSGDNALYDGDEVTLNAVAKTGYRFAGWKVTSPADVSVAFADATAEETTFTMPKITSGSLTIQGIFEVDPAYLSPDCDLTKVELLKQDGTLVKQANRSGTTFTIKLSAKDMSLEEAGNLTGGAYMLRLTYPETATAKMDGGFGDDENGDDRWLTGITNGIGKGGKETFTITAENRTNKNTYTIAIEYDDRPTLTAGTVKRVSDTEASVGFRSSSAGTYYWAVVDAGEAKPDIPTNGAGTTFKYADRENTIKLTSLTAGAKDLYIVVKNDDDSTNVKISDALKISIPAFGGAETTYKVNVTGSLPGGKLTVDKKEAKAGETVTVTVTPDSGKKMTTNSLIYSQSSAPYEVVHIDEKTKQFIMPAYELSVSCRFEDENSSTTPETTTGKIGAFVVNGVSGTVDNTTGMITVTLPNGTDLTSLAPVITISGAKSVSPASGATVNLSSPVTYTLTLEDGTTKTYTVRAYVEGPSKSDQLWNDMLNNVDGSPDHSGSKTWWKKAKDLKKHNDYPEYW